MTMYKTVKTHEADIFIQSSATEVGQEFLP